MKHPGVLFGVRTAKRDVLVGRISLVKTISFFFTKVLDGVNRVSAADSFGSLPPLLPLAHLTIHAHYMGPDDRTWMRVSRHNSNPFATVTIAFYKGWETRA